MRWIVAVLLPAVLAVAAASEPAMFRADAQHSGTYPGAGVPQHGIKWRFRTAGPIVSTPAVADGTVYFGSGDHNVYAVDERTGSLALEVRHARAGQLLAGGRGRTPLRG